MKLSADGTQAALLAQALADRVANTMTEFMVENEQLPRGILPIALLLGYVQIRAHVEGAQAMLVLQLTKTDEERVELANLVGMIQAQHEGEAKRLVAKVLSGPREPPSSESAGTSTATPPG